MVRLALYKGRGKLGNRITRWWTGSIYSHCELVVCGVCLSASFMDGGVRAKQIDLDSGHWDVIPLPWADVAQVLAFFEQTKGRAYDWLGLFRGHLPQMQPAFSQSTVLLASSVPRLSQHAGIDGNHQMWKLQPAVGQGRLPAD